MELACLFYFHLLISYAQGKEDKHSDPPSDRIEERRTSEPRPFLREREGRGGGMEYPQRGVNE